MLRILSRDAARQEFGDLTSTAFLEEMRCELREHSRTYEIPPEAGRMTYLSRTVVAAAATETTTFLCITEWGIGNQNMELFDGYRASLGEIRSLREAPFHVFSGLRRRLNVFWI